MLEFSASEKLSRGPWRDGHDASTASWLGASQRRYLSGTTHENLARQGLPFCLLACQLPSLEPCRSQGHPDNSIKRYNHRTPTEHVLGQGLHHRDNHASLGALFE